MSEFLEFTVIGVAVGAAYAILATGLVVTYTTSGVFNFAHGAVGMIAAFSYWEMQQHHVPEVVGLVVVLVVGAPLLGAVVEWAFMRRLHGASAERPIMVTLGLLVILLGAGLLIWSVSIPRSLSPVVNGTFPLFGVRPHMAGPGPARSSPWRWRWPSGSSSTAPGSASACGRWSTTPSC